MNHLVQLPALTRNDNWGLPHRRGFQMQATFGFTVRAALVGLAAALPAPALAMGSSSPSSTPSVNAPEFDAAAEYRKGIDALQTSKFQDAKSSFARVLGVAP